MNNEDASEPVIKALLNDCILQHLFKFLSITDQRNARLVCKTWALVCPKNAFYFACFNDVPSIDKILTEIPREKLNLNFDQWVIKQDFLFILEKYGNIIESLEIHQCHLHGELFEKIFTHCVNLKKISCRGINKQWHVRKFVGYGFENVNGLQRESLETFIWNCPNCPLEERDVLFITSIYPRLRTFHFEFAGYPFEDCSFFSALFDKLPRGIDIQISITVGRTSEGDLPLRPDPQALSYLNKFTSASINIDAKEDFNLLETSQFRSWKSLCFRSRFESAALLVPSVIVENKYLEDFTFSWQLTNNAEEFITVFTALVNSRLKSLCIELMFFFNDFTTIKDTMDTISLAIGTLAYNQTVLKLHLKVDNLTILHMNSKVPDLFLKYFPKIQDLIFAEDEYCCYNQRGIMLIPVQVQNIFPEPIRGVKSLQMTESHTIQKFNFSNLRYICVEDRITDRSVCNLETFTDKVIRLISFLPKKYPQLEAIEFHWSHYVLERRSLVSFLKSCLNLHHLRYISFCLQGIVSDSSYMDHIDANQLDTYFGDVMFQYSNQRPSIRCIWLETRKNINALYFDKITRRFKFYRRSTEYNYVYSNTHRLKRLWARDY